MSQANVAYDYQSDRHSLDEYPSNKECVLSPSSLQKARERRTSDQADIHPSHTTNNILVSIIDQGNRIRRSFDVPVEQKVANIENNPNNSLDDDSYYSLKRILQKRHGHRDEDSHLSRRVRNFYREQDELIDDYERVYNQGHDELNKENDSLKRQTNILTKVSLGVNIFLFIIKVAAAAISKSLSVVSSVIDSAVDLLTSIILFWTWRIIRKRDLYRYPQGRTRLEPVSIVILSVIMCAASVLVIYQSITTITDDAEYFKAPNSTKTLGEINMSALPISIMSITVVCKVVLYLLCFRVKTPTINALTTDHMNDIVSNIAALACGLLGSFAYKQVINQKAIVIDPIGAVLISIYIIIVWIRQAKDQTKRLSGLTADPKFLSQLTWLTYHHSPLITKIDTVRAFHFGTSYFVEIDIVLPEMMQLREAHDIGEALQKKIEDLPEVERAFVHLDYDYDHHPSVEHKMV